MMKLASLVQRHDITVTPDVMDAPDVVKVSCACGLVKLCHDLPEARVVALIHLAQSQNDEPIFIFRASDVALPGILHQYIQDLRRYGSPNAKINAVREHQDRVQAWQAEHGFKVPD